MNFFFRKNPKETKEDNALLNDIAQVKYELDNAYSNFENVIDPDLIDSYIFEVNAIQKRYKFLLRHAKSLE